MGLSLGLVSRVGLVGRLPAWEGMSPRSFVGREFEKKTKFSPPAKVAIIYRVYGSSNTIMRQLCSSHGSGSFQLILGFSCDFHTLAELDIQRSAC